MHIIEKTLRLNFKSVIWTKYQSISNIKNDVLCNVLNQVR